MILTAGIQVMPGQKVSAGGDPRHSRPDAAPPEKKQMLFPLLQHMYPDLDMDLHAVLVQSHEPMEAEKVAAGGVSPHQQAKEPPQF